MHAVRGSTWIVARGRFEVERALGDGGMGRVFVAFDRKLDRRVALKLPRGCGERSTWSARAHLMREAQALARVRHSHVVELLDTLVEDGRVILVLQLIEGASLRGRTLEWRRAAGVFAQIADGLSAVHAAGLVHRDVSPANIIVDADDRATLIDFGLARTAARAEADAELLAVSLSPADEVGGTVAFMAPEQRAGAAPDPSADRYSLCASLFACIFGVVPTRDNFRAALRDVHAEVCPREMGHILGVGLCEDPRRRFAETGELSRALRSVAAVANLET